MQTKNIMQKEIQLEGHTHLKTITQREYSGQKKCSIDDSQIAQFIPMVHKIAQRVVTYLKPPLSHEDLVSAGIIGLVKAARDYNPSYQASFKTYAYIRTRCAIIDELRGWSFVPSSVQKQIRKAVQLSNEIREKTGSTPTDEQLAHAMGISINALYNIFARARAKKFISINSSEDDLISLKHFLPATSTRTPEEQFEKFELIDKLTKAILQLKEKQRQVIILYYQQQLTMKQIALVLNVAASRISQLRTSALFDLSVKLRYWNDGL